MASAIALGQPWRRHVRPPALYSVHFVTPMQLGKWSRLMIIFHQLHPFRWIWIVGQKAKVRENGRASGANPRKRRMAARFALPTISHPTFVNDALPRFVPAMQAQEAFRQGAPAWKDRGRGVTRPSVSFGWGSCRALGRVDRQ